ncbi:MAG: hypothetical protein ACLPKB_02150 [Xanthobacteraceae bacterium]
MRIIVFISTTRAAILMRRRRNVSNWAMLHIERLGIDTRLAFLARMVFTIDCQKLKGWGGFRGERNGLRLLADHAATAATDG